MPTPTADPSADPSAEPSVGPVPPGRWPWPPLLRASAALHAAAAVSALAEPSTAGWALGAVVANHAAITATGLWPRSQGLGPNLTRLPAAAGRAVALTIDDGPDPAVTPTVLDALDRLGLQATFFCIAERAAAAPALVREILARGHGIENHSLRHRHHFSFSGPRAFADEIGQAQAVLTRLTGRRPIAFRAPAGLRNPFLDPVLHRLGLHLVSWTRRGYDTRERDPARVTARLLGRQGTSLAAGDILLLHDGHAARDAQDRPVLLAVLPALAEALARARLRSVVLGDVLAPRHA